MDDDPLTAPRIAATSPAAGSCDPHETTNQDQMDINNLTIGQARELAAMFATTKQAATEAHPFVGRFVICRCYSAGVHAGILVSQAGDVAVLKDARRLWSWTAKAGIALSGVSQHGLASGKVDTCTPEHALTGVIETIPCSAAAAASIINAKAA